MAAARRADPERALCALMAPPADRVGTLALIVFNHELARIPGLVREPMPGLIRFQWWRDALDRRATGDAPQELMLRTISELCASGRIDRAELDTLVDHREADLEPEPLANLADLDRHARGRAGLLHRLIARACRCASGDALAMAEDVGTAFALAGYAGSVPPPARRLLATSEARSELARLVLALLRPLGRAGRPPAGLLPAILPAIPARIEARALLAGRPVDGPAGKPLLPLRLYWAALRGRV